MEDSAVPRLSDPGRRLSITTPDGVFDGYLSLPAAAPFPVIVVLHEVFGVNADMRATCDELAAAGFAAICPDLFWRQERGVDMSSWSEAEWKKGLALYAAFDLDAGVRDVEATVAAGRTLAGGSGAVGVMGFCLGGLLSFLTVARTEVDAAVAYHGGRTEEFLDEAPDIDRPLLMHLAGDDEFIPAEAQRRIREALSDNPVVEIHTYPRCRHAFARHNGAHYDPAAAALANERTLAFLDRTLRSGPRPPAARI